MTPRRKLFLDTAAARDKIAATPGMIPVDLGAEGLLTWRDVGRYHPYEGFFRKTLSTVDALQMMRAPEREIEYFQTDLDILAGEEPQVDCIPPSGLIFIIGRCGSTLLARALARSKANLVISEAAAHNGFWSALSPERPLEATADARTLARYRRLVLLMARRRLPQHRYHFIKFSCVNVEFAHIILRAFPQTPALFLYRAPEEVLVSYLNKAPAWLRQPDPAWCAGVPGLDAGAPVDRLTYLGAVLERRMRIMLEGAWPQLRLLDYTQLTQDNFPAILHHFGAEYPAQDQAEMARQFSQYSKSDFVSRPFAPDREEKRQALTPEMAEVVDRRLAPVYRRLRASERNLFKDGNA